MKAYEFDDSRNCIKINKVDLPGPWINYLSNGKMHGFISQAAGGPLWFVNPSEGRISRYRSYNIPIDSPGFYVYIRENDGTVWSPAWRPAETELDSFCCEHTAGKTTFYAEKNGTKAKLTVFITPDFDVCLWNLDICSENADKTFDVFAYSELSQHKIMVEYQYGYYIKDALKTWFDEKNQTLCYLYHYVDPMDKETSPLLYFATDRKVESYSGDRDAFLGNYRNDTNPISVTQGYCENDVLQSGNPCFCIHVKLDCKKGAHEKASFMLGMADGGMLHIDEATAKMESDVRLLRTEKIRTEQEEKNDASWKEFMSKFECEIPDKTAQRQINFWGPLASMHTARYSRSINASAVGVRGFGYRDACQDMLAITYRNPQMAKDRLYELLTKQNTSGCAMFSGNSQKSDNHLWVPLLLHSYIAETGDYKILDEVVPYHTNEGEEPKSDTVWNHMKKAMEFTETHCGSHGIALMLRGDWNDIISKFSPNGKGESVFATLQYVKDLELLIEIGNYIGDTETVALFTKYLANQREKIEASCWNGKWWYRCFDDDGNPIGGENDSFGKIWLNSQTWAVIGNVGTKEQQQQAMDAVFELLDTGHGLVKLTPGFETWPKLKNPFSGYNPGNAENGAIFCHAHTWAVIAEAILGDGKLAWKYYTDLIGHNTIEKLGIEKYKAEPYTWCSNILGEPNNKAGWANVNHISGTVPWMNVAATQYLLGVRPIIGGVLFDPCVPEEWSQFKVTREYRGCKLNISFDNSASVCKGVKYFTIDGKKFEGNFLDEKFAEGKKQIDITVVMG